MLVFSLQGKNRSGWEREKNDICIINIVLFYNHLFALKWLIYSCAKMFLVCCQDCTLTLFLTRQTSPFSLNTRTKTVLFRQRLKYSLLVNIITEFFVFTPLLYLNIILSKVDIKFTRCFATLWNFTFLCSTFSFILPRNTQKNCRKPEIDWSHELKKKPKK